MRLPGSGRSKRGTGGSSQGDGSNAPKIDLTVVGPSLRQLSSHSPITDSEIGRIEEKIFSDLKMFTGKLPDLHLVPLQDEAIAAEVDSIFADPEVVSKRDVQDFLVDEWDGIATAGDEPAPVPARGRRLAKAVVPLMCALMIAASVLAAGSRSQVGDLAFPVKLRIESLRLAIAGSPLDQARVLIDVARDRLGSVQEASLDIRELRRALRHLDAAQLGALTRISDEPSSQERDAVLSDLYGLSLSAELYLLSGAQRSPGPISAVLRRSADTANRVAERIRVMLGLGAPTPSLDPYSPTAPARDPGRDRVMRPGGPVASDSVRQGTDPGPASSDPGSSRPEEPVEDGSTCADPLVICISIPSIVDIPRT